MELRGGENDIRASLHSSYTTHHASGGGVERRKDGNHNGSASPVVLTYTTQTLDHHQQQQHQHNRHQNPDRLAIVSTGSNSKPAIRYRECLRNHAASVGGNVFDGCGEFMPGGEEGTLEALKCAACDCHRNFHRKEVDGQNHSLISPSSRRSGSAMIHSLQLAASGLPSPTVVHSHHRGFSMGLHGSSPTAGGANMVQPMAVAFGGGGGGGGTESSSEDLNPFQSHGEGVTPQPPYVLSKKRFRTKFSAEQKDKMMEFAEKVGWRINKQDEEEVEKFCAEVGVRRQVFKVWMHNNKNLKKQQQQQEQEQEQEQQLQEEDQQQQDHS